MWILWLQMGRDGSIRCNRGISREMGRGRVGYLRREWLVIRGRKRIGAVGEGFFWGGNVGEHIVVAFFVGFSYFRGAGKGEMEWGERVAFLRGAGLVP